MNARATLGLALPLAALIAGCTSSSSEPDTAARQSAPSSPAQEDPPSPALAGAAVDRALAWLVAHQDPDGRWDCDGFTKHDGTAGLDEGTGLANHDVGVTGLALLALLGAGHTTTSGAHRDNVERAIAWLVSQQDAESGQIGERSSAEFMYDHAIGSLALFEAITLCEESDLRPQARKALEFIAVSRNPYRVWRYSMPPDGDNDTSVSGWMLLALASAREAGLPTIGGVVESGLEWFDEMTDPATGRVGYVERGSTSSRTVGHNEQYPTDSTETMTAVALACRALLGQTPAEDEAMARHAELLVRALPRWSEDGMTNDMTYWHFGTMAMAQMGGKRWDRWRAAVSAAAMEGQRSDGAADGSWDPNGPWGYAGGRVMSTALAALSLESVERYGNLIAGR